MGPAMIQHDCIHALNIQDWLRHGVSPAAGKRWCSFWPAAPEAVACCKVSVACGSSTKTHTYLCARTACFQTAAGTGCQLTYGHSSAADSRQSSTMHKVEMQFCRHC